MEVLTVAQLKGLEKHKYSSSGSSLVEPVMQVFWRWLIELFPMWIAPNMITIIGLIVNIVCSFLLMWYCPTATETAPSWVYFINCIGLFIYQALDAIDGKQARRTGSSTPLGELFDHGCDSVSCVFVALASSISMQLGDHTWVMFTMSVSSYFTFYFGHWCSYVTGVLQFGLIDVTEIQLFTMLIFFISGSFGPAVWSSQIPVLGYPLHVVPFIFVVVGCLVTYVRFTRKIMNGGCGQNGSTIADTSVISPFFNIAVVVAFCMMIATQSKTMLFHNHPVLYLLFFGFVSAKVTNRLVVAHMTRSELHLLDTSLLGPAALFLNQYFGFYVNEYFLLWICFIHSTFDFMQYMVQTYNQIADHLNVYIFSLAPREGAKKKNN
ncbi:choline/ethanolaminephosphotransferase 1 [Ciona intestinalis]